MVYFRDEEAYISAVDRRGRTTMTLTAEKVREAIRGWPGLYETEFGRKLLGMPVSQVPSRLVKCGWRNVSRMDRRDFEKMGLEVVEARYVGGARPKKFCWVVVASPEGIAVGVGGVDPDELNFINSLPADMRDELRARILYVDRDEDTGLFSIHAREDGV
jgi:hypothetical protein